MKRRRIETPKNSAQSSKKPIFASPQMGTKTNAGKLVAVAKPSPKKTVEKKPAYEKAVWVSRLSPTITEEDVRDYIAANTFASSNFVVCKLVKKGQDVSTLSFVSFKIDVNIIDFNILNDKNAWPVNVAVREFELVSKPKPVTIGDFLLKKSMLNEQQMRISPSKSEDMVVVVESPPITNAS